MILEKIGLAKDGMTRPKSLVVRLRKPWAVELDRLRAERNDNARAVGMAKGRGADTAELIARGQVVRRDRGKRSRYRLAETPSDT